MHTKQLQKQTTVNAYYRPTQLTHYQVWLPDQRAERQVVANITLCSYIVETNIIKMASGYGTVEGNWYTIPPCFV